MAIMNLLQAHFRGQMGEVIGQKWKNKAVIKSSIFGKAPPNKAQTNSVRAFEALNRLSARLAKETWQILGLSDKKMLKHNTIAHVFKNMVKNNTFDPTRVPDSIPESGEVFITGVYPSQNIGEHTVAIGHRQGWIPPSGTQMVFAFFDEKGNTVSCTIADPMSASIQVHGNLDYNLEYYSIIFLSTPENGKFKLYSFSAYPGIGIIYSYEEQHTPDLWLNNEIIYRKSWPVNTRNVQNTGNSFIVVFPFTETPIKSIIKYEIFFSTKQMTSTESLNPFFRLEMLSSPVAGSISLRTDPSYFYVIPNSPNADWATNLKALSSSLTLWYTKEE